MKAEAILRLSAFGGSNPPPRIIAKGLMSGKKNDFKFKKEFESFKAKL